MCDQCDAFHFYCDGIHFYCRRRRRQLLVYFSFFSSYHFYSFALQREQFIYVTIYLRYVYITSAFTCWVENNIEWNGIRNGFVLLACLINVSVFVVFSLEILKLSMDKNCVFALVSVRMGEWVCMCVCDSMRHIRRVLWA